MVAVSEITQGHPATGSLAAHRGSCDPRVGTGATVGLTGNIPDATALFHHIMPLGQLLDCLEGCGG